MPLFSFTLSFHELQSSPPSFITKVACFLQGMQITRQFWCTGMQRSSKAKIKAVWLLYLCKTNLFTSSMWKMLYLPSTGFDLILTFSLETVFTKSTNKQPLEMTAPATCKPLVCGTGMYLGSFAHPLYGELKLIFNRCDSRANITHSARAKVCKLRVQTQFPSQD